MKTFEILTIVLTILFVSTLFIKRYVYFRSDRKLQPNMFGFEDVFEGNLHAWYKKGNRKQVILFCHGNIGNLSYSFRQTKLNHLNTLGYNVLIFDYNGYGKSKGIPNESYCVHNTNIFMSYLFQKGFSRENIVPYGENIGAYIATHIAVKYNLPNLILESSFPSIKKYLSSYTSLLKPLGIIFHEFNCEKELSMYKGRVLLIHSIHDKTIPLKYIDALKRYSSKTIETIGSHCSVEFDWKEIDDFLKNISK